MKSHCNAEHAGRALLCFTVILWYCFIDGKHGDHDVWCHSMTVILSPGCSLLQQERTASVDRGQGPLHLWMLSLNALDFWLTDRIAEGGSVDLLILRNHSNSYVWGYPVVCFFCKLLITNCSEGPGEAEPSLQSLSCPTVLLLSSKHP